MYHVQRKYKVFLSIIDYIGSILFFWKKCIPFNINKIKNVLVIRLDHIGDILLTTPVIRTLKEKIPAANIDILIRPFTKNILETNPYINKIHTLNPPWFRRESASFFNLFKFIYQNLFKYDLVVELHADPRNIILANFVGKYVIGYNIRGFGFLLNKSAVYAKSEKHILERNLDVVRAIGLDSDNKMDIFLTDKDNVFADTLFDIHNIKNAVCIVPGTGRTNKFWFNDRWAELADHIIKKYGAKIVFLGGKEDIPRIADITRQMALKKHINMVGRTSLRESVAIIKKSRLVICPDTGMMHAAKAVDTPCIALFGPVNPKIWGYNDKNHKSLFVKLSCSFCDIPLCINKEKNVCMSSILVARVIKAVSEIIK